MELLEATIRMSIVRLLFFVPSSDCLRSDEPQHARPEPVSASRTKCARGDHIAAPPGAGMTRAWKNSLPSGVGPWGCVLQGTLQLFAGLLPADVISADASSTYQVCRLRQN